VSVFCVGVGFLVGFYKSQFRIRSVFKNIKYLFGFSVNRPTSTAVLDNQGR